MKLTSKLKLAFVIFAVLLTVNCFSFKAGYNADEQAQAERGVKEVNRLYNEQNFEGIYNLFSKEAQQNINKDNFLTSIKQGFAELGKIQSASLSQAKVIPSTPVEVRMVYNVKFEKGDFQQWFVWVNRGDKAELINIQTFPGFDNPNSKE